MKYDRKDRGSRPARMTGTAIAAACLSLGLALTSCGGSGGGGKPGDAASPTFQTPPGPQVPQTPQTRKVTVSTTTVTPAAGVSPVKAVRLASGLDHPWALAFLPDGRMLVTERGGQMQLVGTDGDETSLTPLSGVPPVVAVGQGGLLDVQVDPDFSDANPWVYWSYAEPGTGAEAGLSGTAVARGKLSGAALTEVTVIFRQQPKVSGNNHYGSRLVFRPDGTLFVALGERNQDSNLNQPTRDNAQNLAKHLGKVVRINKDGSLPGDSFVWNASGALPGIWSTGHRNIQGAALNPATNDLWVAEHGPQGGDEVNIALAGRNFGWPLRSYGCPYDAAPPTVACRVGGGTHAPDFTEPVTYWPAPSTAPSGMVFFTSGKLPELQGKLLVGALQGRSVWRISFTGNNVASRDELFKDAFGRIRDVRQGPDGWLYLLDDTNGRLIRIER